MREASAHDRLPRGQVLTQKWPVLTFGDTPEVDLQTWTFRCLGLVEEPVSWTWQEFLELPRVEVTSDVHCVTRWSRYDNRWEGVAVSQILRRVRPKGEATAVMVHAEQEYTTNLLLDDLRGEDVLLAIKHDGRDLPNEHGGPCRLVVPRLYFWKSATRPRKPMPCSGCEPIRAPASSELILDAHLRPSDHPTIRSLRPS